MTYIFPAIPLDVLFGNPVRCQPQLSPDGTKLAFLAPIGSVLNIWLDGSEHAGPVPLTHETSRGIQSYHWSGDGRYLLYEQDTNGNEDWQIHAIDSKTREHRNLTPFDGVQAQIIQIGHLAPDEILVALNKENVRLFDVYSLHLASGALRLVAKNPGNVVRWIADAGCVIRAAYAVHTDGSRRLLIPGETGAEWQTVMHWNAEDANSGPLGCSGDGKLLYLRDTRNAETGRLISFNWQSGDIVTLAENPVNDFKDVLYHPENYEVQAVAFACERTHWTVLDPAIQSDFELLLKHRSADLSILNRDRSGTLWVVAYFADNGPISYYKYDGISQQLTFLFDNKPALHHYSLSTMEPITFTARDGLSIHGYLSFPPHGRRMNLPLILNVHGGPWLRNSWGYNPEVQWMTNRGYACLQVNFRGSSGYGKSFLNAGDHEWGGKMLNDLLDATQWVIDQHIADPARIAIFGASYGGYAALAAATFAPDVFCCGIDICGPSNLNTLVKSVPSHWGPYLAMLYQRIGNPDTEQELVKARSPLFAVDEIKIPLLIVHGANDPRVKESESQQIVALLQQKRIPHEYLLFPDEGHGIVKPENKYTFYRHAERFLETYV